MLTDPTTLYNAKKLKKEADAAYLVFKKNPSVANANSWTMAVRAFNDYCVTMVKSMIEDDAADKTADILANPDKYKTCGQCGAEVLYLTSDKNYVASSDFIEDFPGWCYPCLVEHCTTHECEGCTVPEDYRTCSFKEAKNLLMQGES